MTISCRVTAYGHLIYRVILVNRRDLNIVDQSRQVLEWRDGCINQDAAMLKIGKHGIDWATTICNSGNYSASRQRLTQAKCKG
ncbi:MAG TPA: hypothetical protein VFH31_11475 [Pyrinomonadaceae bacterium]|nr:hypothetical protein [Pyrinomonadaceae bacterium]